MSNDSPIPRALHRAIKKDLKALHDNEATLADWFETPLALAKEPTTEGPTPLHHVMTAYNEFMAKCYKKQWADREEDYGYDYDRYDLEQEVEDRMQHVYVPERLRFLVTAVLGAEGAGIDVNAQAEPDGSTALHIYLTSKAIHRSVVAGLLDAGAKVEVTDVRGNTALHILATHHPWEVEVLELLLERGGAALAVVENAEGKTPLITCIENATDAREEDVLAFARTLLRHQSGCCDSPCGGRDACAGVEDAVRAALVGNEEIDRDLFLALIFQSA